MQARFRSLSILSFLLLGFSPQVFARDAEPEIGATFLSLEPGMKGQVALHWQGDPAAKAQVFIDFNGDGAWSSEELVLDETPLSEEMTLHKVEVPSSAKIDFSTRARLVVYGPARQVWLDFERPLYEARENEQASLASACSWRPGMAAAPPAFPVSAMAIHDDGSGAALFTAIYNSYSDPDSGITTTTSYLQKWTGSGWSTLGPAMSESILVLLSYGGSLYAGGQFSVGGISYLARWNGQSWEPVGGAVNGPVLALAEYQGKLYIGGSFNRIGSMTANRIARWDGFQWDGLRSGANDTVQSLKVWNSNLYAGGFFTSMDGVTAHYVAKYDGYSWSKVAAGSSNGLSQVVYDLESFGSGANSALYAGGAFGLQSGTAIAKWDGATWTSPGIVNGSILTLEPFTDAAGNTALYVGGQFTSVEGTAATYMARFTGSTWQSLGNGANGYVQKLLATTDSVPILWTSGTFNVTPDGNAVPYLARYDGVGFGALGQGTNGDVNTLRADGADLLAGGEFTTAGGVLANRIARWDGNRWWNLRNGSNSEVYDIEKWDDGSGPTFFAATAGGVLKWNGTSWTSLALGEVRSLTVWNGKLYAAASSQMFSGTIPVFHGYLASWNGSAWQAVSQAPQTSIFALAVGPDNHLYVGGDFGTAGGAPTKNIARFDGNNWSSLGPGLNSDVYSLGVHRGHLYAGGNFTATADGSTVLEKLAKWTGTHWETVGGGTNNPVRALASFELEIGQPRLIVAGQFTRAGGLELNRLAAFDDITGAWEDFGQGLDGPVIALAQIEGPERILYVGGNFLSAGAQPAHYIARWVCPGILPPPTGRGDCDGNSIVELADRQAIHLEVFDGDNNDPNQAPAGTYPGHPIGCNTNGDLRIDAGDLACLDLLLSGGSCSTGSPSSRVPVLSMPADLVVTNGQTLVPVYLDPADHLLRTLSFSIAYDEEALIPAGDLASTIEKPGLSPGGTLLVRHVAAERRIEISLIQPDDAKFPAGPLIRIPMTAVGPATTLRQAMVPSQNNVFAGDLEGRSIPGQFILDPELIETLILTHTGRLGAIPGLGFEDPASRGLLLTHLQQLAGHSRVRGLVVDLADYPELNNLYDTWDPGSSDAVIANRVLLGNGGLIDFVANLLETFPTLKYLQIVGDDRIIPMARLLDQTEIPEQQYTGNGLLAQIGTESSIGKSLAANYFLSDDPLASGDRNAALAVSQNPWKVLLPRLAPGRLIETADEIFASIELYFEFEGQVDLSSLALSERQTLVSGYDIVSGGATQVASHWRAVLGATSPESPITPVDSRLVSPDWDAQDLLGALRNTDGADGIGPGKSKILSLNGHATHWQIGVPTTLAGITTSDIYGANCATTTPQGSSLDLEGAVVLGMSCHGGLSIPGSCENDPDHSLDLPQTLLASRALVYGDNSGFGWATWNGWGLGERLALDLGRRILTGESVGDSVRAAKQRYYNESFIRDPYDHKTLLQWTLYGFPMTVVRQGGSSAVSGENLGPPQFGPPDADGFQRGTVGEVVVARRLSQELSGLSIGLPDHLTRAEVRVDLTANGVYRKYNHNSEELPTSDSCPEAGCYYRLNGLATDESNLPIQPFFVYESTLNSTVPRESLWMGGEYRTEENWRPLFSGMQSAGSNIEITVLPMQYYVRPRGGGGSLADTPGNGCLEPNFGFDDATGRISILTGELVPSSLGPLTWRERIFEKIDFEAFYFGRTPQDCRAPLLTAASDTSYSEGNRVYWRITTTDEPSGGHSSGVWRVVVVWDNEEMHRYEPVDLELRDGVWQGSIDAANLQTLRYYVQAADREGNVGWLNHRLSHLLPTGIDPELAAIRSVAIEQMEIITEVPIFADGFESGDLSAWNR